VLSKVIKPLQEENRDHAMIEAITACIEFDEAAADYDSYKVLKK
jgi:hypothetical protein